MFLHLMNLGAQKRAIIDGQPFPAKNSFVGTKTSAGRSRILETVIVAIAAVGFFSGTSIGQPQTDVPLPNAKAETEEDRSETHQDAASTPNPGPESGEENNSTNSTDAPADDSVSDTVEAGPTLEEIFAGELPQSIDDLRAIESHVQTLVEDLKPATVGIQLGQAQGSGVIISPDGYVLTAAHVIGKPGEKANIMLPDGRTFEAVTLGMNHTIDSGMLKITEEGDWPYLDMGESTELRNGQWVVSIGHPGGFDPLRGPVVRLGRVTMSNATVINTDCTLVGGDSGGPLFDMDGYVIGIHSRIGPNISQNMHVPINTYGETWDKLEASEVMGRAGGFMPRRINWGFGVRIRDGQIRVSRINRGSPAEQAGLQVNDLITAINDTEVKTRSQLNAAIVVAQTKKTFEMSVTRDSRVVKLTFTRP